MLDVCVRVCPCWRFLLQVATSARFTRCSAFPSLKDGDAPRVFFAEARQRAHCGVQLAKPPVRTPVFLIHSAEHSCVSPSGRRSRYPWLRLASDPEEGPKKVKKEEPDYDDGQVKRTLERELKVPEIAEREANDVVQQGDKKKSDPRIEWPKEGSAAWSLETAAAVVLRLANAPLAEVAHFKIGYTSDPHWRFTGLPVSDESTTEPHYLSFSRMKVLFSGQGMEAAIVERDLIQKFRECPKLQNSLGGANGPISDGVGFVYVVYNTLAEVVAHPLAVNRSLRSRTFCDHCKCMTLALEDRGKLFATACACSYSFFIVHFPSTHFKDVF